MGIAQAVNGIFELIFLLLFISILLTWIPNIKWHNEPFKTLRTFSEIFFAPFRALIPPVGMLDLSPIVAFICLSILQHAVVTLLSRLGL